MGMQINIIWHNTRYNHFLKLANRVFALSGVINRTSFANHTDLDLSRVIEVFFNFMGDIAGQAIRGKLVNFFRFNDDTNLAASLDSKGFFHAGERVRGTLKRLPALDIPVDGLTARA